MRKGLVVLALLLLPTALFAQSGLQVTSTVGQVEWRTASGRTFVPAAKNQVIQPGDELRTGSGAQLILAAPDGSYMVVSENSQLIVDDFWSGSFKSIMNVMLGQVRFYIQRLGGRPNPYSVRTPTALIAVRGTTFDVFVDDAQFAEVRCLEGRVTVENVAISNREVILEPGHHTLVRPGEVPLMPVGNDEPLNWNRIVKMQKKNAPEVNGNSIPSIEMLAHDNDRGSRTTNPQASTSRTNSNTDRAKPTLSFPQ
jgi:ferric-dicitrate binding protein FerR (iron transport regulator)